MNCKIIWQNNKVSTQINSKRVSSKKAPSWYINFGKCCERKHVPRLEQKFRLWLIDYSSSFAFFPALWTVCLVRPSEISFSLSDRSLWIINFIWDETCQLLCESFQLDLRWNLPRRFQVCHFAIRFTVAAAKNSPIKYGSHLPKWYLCCVASVTQVYHCKKSCLNHLQISKTTVSHIFMWAKHLREDLTNETTKMKNAISPKSTQAAGRKYTTVRHDVIHFSQLYCMVMFTKDSNILLASRPWWSVIQYLTPQLPVSKGLATTCDLAVKPSAASPSSTTFKNMAGTLNLHTKRARDGQIPTW